MLSEKVVCITGASSGIGLATAESFAKAGCHLIIGARRVERLHKISEDLKSIGAASVLPVALDVRSNDSVDNFYDQVKASFERVHILINNAGLVLGTDSIAEGQIHDWETILNTNVLGVLRMSRKFLPDMIKNQNGHIIMIGSISGHQVYPGGGPYCATKHAVKALTQTLKLELNGKGIRVTSIDPGMVESEFSIVRFNSEEKAKDVYRGMKPLTPNDVAQCILFTASQPSHVNIDEIILTPLDQASVNLVHRNRN